MTYTHYDYLDLAPGASPARIEAAYAAVLERFQYGAGDADQDLSGLIRMIHAAYDVLGSGGGGCGTQIDARRATNRGHAVRAGSAVRAVFRVHVSRRLTATSSSPAYGRRESFFSRLQTAMRSAAVFQPQNANTHSFTYVRYGADTPHHDTPIGVTRVGGRRAWCGTPARGAQQEPRRAQHCAPIAARGSTGRRFRSVRYSLMRRAGHPCG